MKFGQILMYITRNISNTVFWLFYDFSKMAIQRDLSVFSSWYLSLLILPYSPFQKTETLETWRNWLLSNWSRLLNSNGSGTQPSPPFVQKSSEKYCPCLYLSIDQDWWVNELWFKRCTLSHVLILTMTSQIW